MRAIVVTIFRAVLHASILVALIPLALTVLYAFIDPPALPVLRRQAAGMASEQTFVPLADISPDLSRAVIMAEDARFCLHWGIDVAQLRIVVDEALSGEETRGASTISMQVVKTLFLWPERSYLRKALELPLALWLDLVLSKDRILEIYLNVAQWGPRQFGAEAAARHFFGKPASALTRQEALALATTLPLPAVRNPRRPSRRQRAAMARVERELNRAPWVFSCLPPALRL